MNIKILTYNMHKGVGWGGKKTLTHLYRQFEELNPNIIFLQEACGNQIDYLSTLFPHVSYGKNVDHLDRHHGNAILSHFPISYSQNLDISVGKFEKRGLLHSIIQHNQDEVHLICTHLGLLRSYRNEQLKIILSYVKNHIPTQAPLILGGDFNDWSSHLTSPLIQELGLSEPFLSKFGTHARTFPAWIPILKLDRLYSRGFNFGEISRLTDNSWKKLSDHLALNVELELQAPNFQASSDIDESASHMFGIE